MPKRVEMFQFQNGTIKRPEQPFSDLLLTSFNSKMVRLKAVHICCIHFVFVMFQFQNGTIKRILEFAQKTFAAVFQFQNGTIKSPDGNTDQFNASAFQFQNGTIKSGKNGHR